MVAITLYDSLVRRLYQVNMWNPAKMGLSNIKRLHEALGNPMDGLPAVHIAGTNGKGSVALKMARSLQLGGIRTGLFVSPHVSCFRERMQVDGELISEEGVEEILPKIFQLCEARDIPATFFEITTAVAFQHFRNSNVDAVVIEAGLGGRLDSTNIITPKLSIITSVGLDHMQILGDTIEEIATDKSGIIKPGIPALVGEACPVDLIRGLAEERGSPFYRWRDAFPSGTPPPANDYDAENSRLAEAALRLLWRTNAELQVDEEAIKLGIAQRPPCRFEVIQMHVPESGVPVRVQHPSTDDTVCSKGKMPASEGRGSSGGGSGGGCGTNGERLEVGDGDEVTVVLDVAHNPPAIVRAMEKVRREFSGRRVRVVTAFSGDKDSKTCLSTLLDLATYDRIHLAEASTRRATPTSVLASTLAELTDGAFDPKRRARSGGDSVREAVRDAILEAAKSGTPENPEKDVVVVCGTIFMMVDARQELGFDEPQDAPCVEEVAGYHFRAAQDNVKLSGTHG